MADPTQIVSIDYRVPITGIVHVGADANDASSYASQGTGPAVLIQASPELLSGMRSETGTEQDIVEAVCLEAAGVEVDFHIYSDPDLSSVLQLSDESRAHGTLLVRSNRVISTTVDELLKDDVNYNVLNISVPGCEPRVLCGALKTLRRIEFTFITLDERPLYKGRQQTTEIHAFMLGLGHRLIQSTRTKRGEGVLLFRNPDLSSRSL